MIRDIASIRSTIDPPTDTHTMVLTHPLTHRYTYCGFDPPTHPTNTQTEVLTQPRTHKDLVISIHPYMYRGIEYMF